MKDENGDNFSDPRIQDKNITFADIRPQWLINRFSYIPKSNNYFELFLNRGYTRNQIWHGIKLENILSAETWLTN